MSDEAARLEGLRALQILDTEPEEAFDRVVELAARLFDVPIALVTLVDEHRQWFKARLGLAVSETPRSSAFCAHAIEGQDTLVIPDAQADPRFADNPLVVGEPRIRFYAGHPLRSPEGLALGTLCIIDRRPRQLTDAEHDLLTVLARQAEVELHLRQAGLLERAARLELAEVQASMAAVREELAASEHRYRALVEGASMALLVHVDGEIRFANSAAAELHGAPSPAAMVGRSIYDTVPERDRPALRQRVELVTAGGRVRDLRRPLCRDDGSVITVAVHVTPVEWEAVAASQVELRDVTARAAGDEGRRRHMQELRELNTELAQAVALKDHVLAAATHDMRTPITSIAALADLLDRGPARGMAVEDQAEALAAIGRQARRLDRLVGDLLSLAVVEGGSVELRRQPVPLAQLVEELVEDIDLDLRVTVAIAADLVVDADPDRLAQVVDNLLTNAQRYGGPTVEVRAERDGAWVALRVSDDGDGVPDEFVPELFEKFTRASRLAPGPVRGTGLGLAIVRAVARAHGGDVRYERSPSGGASFVVRLPSAAGPSA